MRSGRVKTGVDLLLEAPEKYLRSRRIGVITNPTGITSEVVPDVDAFLMNGRVSLKAVFGPEHGAAGDAQDGRKIRSTTEESGLVTHSLFGRVLKPTKRMLEGLDAVVFDIQDVGARFYTYPSTMTYALEAARENHLRFYVLDRPNPINGLDFSGNVLHPDFVSFVGLNPVPIRHGMTIGELALLINDRVGAELEVIPLTNWKREMWFDQTGLTWIQPSPNVPTLDTAIVYPGTCLFEGTNLSEGRGTTRPFEVIGAPWLDGKEWASALNSLGLHGVVFRPCFFTPYYSKYRGSQCGGVQVHVLDRDRYEPLRTALHMLQTALQGWPQDFRWLPAKPGEHCHFDLLAGTDKTRIQLSEDRAVEDIVEDWKDSLSRFAERREEFLLYPERDPK